MKKFFADNKNMGKDGMRLCAAAYKKSKSGGQDTHVMPDGAVHTGKVHTKDSKVVKEAPKAGRVPNPGKPIPKKQLMSSRGKMESKSRKNSSWLAHLAEFRKNNKTVKSKDVFREAKKTYKKPEKKKPAKKVEKKSGS